MTYKQLCEFLEELIEKGADGFEVYKCCEWVKGTPDDLVTTLRKENFRVKEPKDECG